MLHILVAEFNGCRPTQLIQLLDMRIPSLKLLAGFEAAARHGNFSRAADELHLSQSAISHQIQQLEEHVGVALFRRVGRGVELTIAGEVLHRSVVQSFETLHSGLNRIATYRDPGLVVLVCPGPLLHGWLQPQIDRLQHLIPELCPIFATDETARYVDEVNVDIMISDHPIQQPGLMEQPLLKDEWVVAAAAGLAAQLKEIPRAEHHLHADMVCLEKNITDDTTAAIFHGELAKFRKRGIYDDQRLLLDAVLRGRGIACISRLLARDDLANGRLSILPDYQRLPGTTWWLSHVDAEPRAKIVLDVSAWLLAQAQQEP